ncbi:MAG: tetratricopeptide repeat protein, partial [Candidatus Thiodiazotropha sp. (ex Lucinoma borealis)]|nr:tetratricopeptide repeat protein [Candidatus Thiodiazotropha sp. (ex Lucinoma borealis)]
GARHDGSTVSPHGYRGLTASAFSLPWRSAKDAQLITRDKLTDSYHRQAMQLFRKQELDEAIGYWNKIIELNPNHSLAPGYKARALEMKQQLQKIGPGS